MSGVKLVITLILLALTGRVAAAQAVPTASGPGSNITLGGGVSAFQQDYGHNIVGGGWVFADVNPHWRFGLEGEARWLRLHQEQQVTESNYLGGLRVEILPHPRRYEPYAKFLAGAGLITLPYGYAHGGFLALAPGAGLDIVLNDRMAVRAADFEYQLWPDFRFGPLKPYGVSAGLRIRLTRPKYLVDGPRLRRSKTPADPTRGDLTAFPEAGRRSRTVPDPMLRNDLSY